jgi:predicted nucleotidyltransferase
VNGLKDKESVYGIGLFGSWSRGEATSSSDVDLLILDKGNFDFEYVERLEMGGLFIDLDHFSRKWIQGLIPSTIDQKLYEMHILYDRDWSLANTKLLMARSYSSPERVDIRTEAHVVDSDIYLSRATSALSREDYRSAFLFATVALESILKVLIEIALEPFSHSHFIERLKDSATKLQMSELFDTYLEVARLNKVNSTRIEDELKLFKAIWNEICVTIRRHPQVLESSHFKVKTKLGYYSNPAFFQGALIRTNSLVDSEKIMEASNYLKNILLDIVENYVWLKSSINKVKIDYTTLMRSLESLEEKSPKNYVQITDFLNLSSIGKPEAANAIEKAREIMFRIRKDRKVLIKKVIKK